MNNFRVHVIACMVMFLFFCMTKSGVCADNEKNASILFESTFVDSDIVYTTVEVQIGPTKVNIPIPHDCNYEIRDDGEGITKTRAINIKKGKDAQLLAVFNVNNIEKDDGRIYIGVREYFYERHLLGKVSEDANAFVTGPTSECLVAYPSTFEYNQEKGYLFRTKTVCKIDGEREAAVVVSVGSLHFNGYFLSIIILDFQPRGDLSRKIVHSWFRSLLENN